jgi:hypothetical protein
MLAEARMLARFAHGLRSFYSRPITAESARQTLTESLRNRGESFLSLTAQSVFPIHGSPYRWLLQRAGITQNDLAGLVRADGLDRALERLLDAGVYLTIDEFKGRSPIRRGGESFETAADSFDNPAFDGHAEGTSSGSSGPARRLVIDLDVLGHDGSLTLLFSRSAGILQSPAAFWRPVPPGAAGLKHALIHSLLKLPFERWFTPQPFKPYWPDSKSWAITSAALLGSRLAGSPIPMPEFLSLQNPSLVARWMAQVRSQGLRPYLNAPVSAAVGVARAALDGGMDISGTFFRVGGEPLTPPRSAVLRAAGGRFSSHYAIAEVGIVAAGCCDANADDDGHLAEGKLSATARASVPGVRAPDGVEPLFITTLLPYSPKIMINVESGDTATREIRSCGCELGAVGLRTHLSNIRSYEKLATAGMHFLGSTIMKLTDEVLPQRFGGIPTDYQFVESDIDGGARIYVRVHPRLGPLSESEIAGVILDELARGAPANRMMSGLWRQGEVVQIERQAPEPSAGGKILPLRQRAN